MTLDERVSVLEQHLDALDAAFASSEPQAVDAASERLQLALMEAARAVVQPGQAPLRAELRERLDRARARAAAQLAQAHRANQTFQRTLQVLLPREQADTYGVLGNAPSALNAYR